MRLLFLLLLTPIFAFSQHISSNFNPVILQNGTVTKIAQQTDGKKILIGQFTYYNDAAKKNIVRINADGSVDAGFHTHADGTIRVAYPLSTGKILIGGSFTKVNNTEVARLVRLNADGSLDNTFQPNNSFLPQAIGDLTVQLDGKIIVIGYAEPNATKRRDIVRLNVDGTLDSGFNPGPSDEGSSIFTVALGANGKIIVGGNFNFFHGTQRKGLARLNANGTLDETFVISEQQLTGGTSLNSATINTLTTQLGGKIIAAGRFSIGNTNSAKLLRFNADGTLDNTFQLSENYGEITSLTVTLENQIVFGTHMRVVILNDNGSKAREISFLNPPAMDVRCVLLQLDGSLAIGGEMSGAFPNASSIQVYSINGQKSTDFQPGVGPLRPGRILAVKEHNSKLLIGGRFFQVNGKSLNNIARLNIDGSVDESFQPGTGTDDDVSGLEVWNNKVYLIGTFSKVNGVNVRRIARINENGSVDNTFAPGTGPNNVVYYQALQPDGKLIVTGYISSYNNTSFNLSNDVAYTAFRINTDGSLDQNFTIGKSNNSVYSLTVLSSGKILVTGYMSAYNGTPVPKGFVKLNTNGTIDQVYSSPSIKSAGSSRMFESAPGKIAYSGQGSYFPTAVIITENGEEEKEGIPALLLAKTNDGGFIYRVSQGPSLKKLNANLQDDPSFKTIETKLHADPAAVVLTNGNVIFYGRDNDYLPVFGMIELPAKPVTVPQNLTATSGGEGLSIALSWQHTGNEESGFEIFRSVDNNSNYVSVGYAPEDATSFVDQFQQTTYKQYFYKIRAVNASGASDFSNEANTIQTSLQPETESMFSVYPNPVNRYLQIESFTPVVSTIRLTTLEGRTLYTATISDRAELDLAELPKGIYILEISNGKTKVCRRLVR